MDLFYNIAETEFLVSDASGEMLEKSFPWKKWNFFLPLQCDPESQKVGHPQIRVHSILLTCNTCPWLCICIESQNTPSWKRPMRIWKTNLLPHRTTQKSSPVSETVVQNVSWTELMQSWCLLSINKLTKTVQTLNREWLFLPVYSVPMPALQRKARQTILLVKSTFYSVNTVQNLTCVYSIWIYTTDSARSSINQNVSVFTHWRASEWVIA